MRPLKNTWVDNFQLSKIPCQQERKEYLHFKLEPHIFVTLHICEKMKHFLKSDIIFRRDLLKNTFSSRDQQNSEQNLSRRKDCYRNLATEIFFLFHLIAYSDCATIRSESYNNH